MQEIIFIYANSCKDCARMKKILTESLEEYRLSDIVTVVEYDSDDDVAVDIAVKYQIYDIPGCNVNGKSFFGKNFSSNDIKDAIKSLA